MNFSHTLLSLLSIGISMNTYANQTHQCVLDMGSNTFKFAIFKKENASFKMIFSRRDPMGVGDDITQNKAKIKKSVISDSKLAEIDKVFASYQAICKNDYKTDHIKALATAAFRDAENGKTVIGLGKKNSIKIKIVSINEEASLAFQTANHLGVKADLVLDLGSRTTEIANQNKSKLETSGYEFGYRTLFKDFFENKNSIQEIQIALFSHLEKTVPTNKSSKTLKIVEFGEAASYILKAPQEETDEKTIKIEKLEAVIADLKANKDVAGLLKEKNIDRALPRILTAYWYLNKTGLKEFISIDRELYYGLLE